MEPFYKEYLNDDEAVTAVDRLKTQGISEDNIYIITHDKERTNRLADEADANTAGAKEQGIGESIKNVFRKQGDELRAKFQELGYTEAKAEELEDKLDDGKVILIVKDAPTDLSL